ncbi:hypothetical protein TYRP_005035, partial [Tyrophagus putrescentiae]
MARTRSKNKRSANAPIIPESVYSENSLPSEQSQPENNNESENHYIFQLSKFDYDSIIEKHRMNDKAHVKTFNWSQFNRSSTDSMASLYAVLSPYYKSKLSSKLRRDICATMSSKLPYMEKRYLYLRKKSFAGKHPALSRNVQSFTSFADLLYARLEKHYRDQLKLLAQKEGFQLYVLKGNGEKVAESNKMRKK